MPAGLWFCTTWHVSTRQGFFGLFTLAMNLKPWNKLIACLRSSHLQLKHTHLIPIRAKLFSYFPASLPLKNSHYGTKMIAMKCTLTTNNTSQKSEVKWGSQYIFASSHSLGQKYKQSTLACRCSTRLVTILKLAERLSWHLAESPSGRNPLLQLVVYLLESFLGFPVPQKQ